MKVNTHFVFYLIAILMSTSLRQVNGQSILNWFWGSKENPEIAVADGVPLLSIPYEMMTEDEKFLKEAAKFVTDIQISSPLEICQHKVVLKIKTSCSNLSEEDLAKLSVNLLNCQSATEGRKVFPCTENMSLKQCTTNMDADTWNAYHLMSNRARAVCYAARSHQFRALTELTVNKLMQSAHSQIEKLATLMESQDRLEEQTLNAHRMIETNIQDLTDEKALIRAGHDQLATMAEDIKKKLEKASQDLQDQATERGENHKEILADLESINNQTQLLWEKIEKSTSRIIEQNYRAAARYDETMVKLEKINQTVIFISDLTNSMRTEIDKKLGWITEYIGKTGENLDKVYRVVLHIVYLLAAMIVAAFLQAPFLTRSAILGIIPLNLASYLKHGISACLDFVSLTVLIMLITAMHYIMNGIQYMLRPKEEGSKDKSSANEKPVINVNGHTVLNGCSPIRTYENENEIDKLEQNFSILQCVSNLWKSANNQIFKTIENFKALIFSMNQYIRHKFRSTEELSCSYLPSKRYQDRIIAEKMYPSLSSDDSSDFSDSNNPERFLIHDNNSMSGAVLRRKAMERTVTPISAVFTRKHDPVRLLPNNVPNSRSVTPVTRALCAAKTRSGNPCRLAPSRGQNYCHKHSTGSSAMGD